MTAPEAERLRFDAWGPAEASYKVRGAGDSASEPDREQFPTRLRQNEEPPQSGASRIRASASSAICGTLTVPAPTPSKISTASVGAELARPGPCAARKLLRVLRTHRAEQARPLRIRANRGEIRDRWIFGRSGRTPDSYEQLNGSSGVFCASVASGPKALTASTFHAN